MPDTDDEKVVAPFSTFLMQQRNGVLMAELSEGLNDLVEAVTQGRRPRPHRERRREGQEARERTRRVVALASAKPEQLGDDGHYAVVIPAGGRLELVDLDLERQEDTPRRKRERVEFYDGASLAAYVVKHDRGDGSAVLFGDVEHRRVVAVLLVFEKGRP